VFASRTNVVRALLIATPLLGVLTTLVVAWELGAPPRDHAEEIVSYQARGATDCFVQVLSASGLRVTIVAPDALGRATLGEDAQNVPGWFHRYESTTSIGAIRVSSGWPLICISEDMSLDAAANISSPGPWIGTPHAVPFLVNSALWSLPWLVLMLLAVHGLRRARRRHGHCPTCNYDLNHEHDSGCPECGWNRAEPNATA
jgi:hypothetical protein